MRAEEPPRLAVLGDIALFDDAGAETPLAPQRLTILAALAAAAGSVVPRATLIEELWGRDSDAARQRLKSQIAQIRSALGRGLAIEFRLDGYRLSGSLDQLDSTRFESLVTTARQLAPDEAVAHYEAALALWRGPVAFGGIDSLLVDEARRSLEVLHLATAVALGRCELELRRPRSALEPLLQLYDRDPTRGDVTGVAASLLALAGRHRDALRLIDGHRTALIDIGLAPDTGIGALEGRILRHDPDLGAAPVAGGRPDRAGRPDGRPLHRELLHRRGLEQRVISELATRPVALWGEAGVGKSALAATVAELSVAAGRSVIRASARPDPTRPMEAVAELVAQLLVSRPERSRDLLSRPATAAAVGRLGGDHRPGGMPISRDELIAELTGFVHELAGDGDCLQLVEDAHWLDNSSAEILGRLLDRGQPNLLITTRRPLADLVGPAWDRAAQVEIPPLTVAEVRQLVAHTLPVRANDELAQHLHDRTGGNGLFLRLELDLLAEGRLGRDLQPTVLHAVHERTAGFSRLTRDVLQTAALLGQSFPLAPLAAIHPNLSAALQDAVDEHLIRLDPGTGTGQFVHGLVVDAFVELQPPAMRVTRHDQLWVELARLGASPVVLAKHAVGADELDPLRAVTACRDAAGQEAEVFEWAAAMGWARHGLATLDRFGLDEPQPEAELRLMVGRSLRRLNRAGSDGELRRAAGRAAQVDDHALFVRCVTELCLHGQTTRAGTVDDGARQLLDQALVAPVDPLARAELMSAAATLLAISEDSGHGRALYRQALDVTATAGDPTIRRTVLMNAHLGLPHPDDLARRRRAARDILAFDDHEAQWEGQYLRFGLALMDADRAALDAAVRELGRLTSAVRQRDHQQSLRQIEAVHAFVRGDLAEAGRLADRAFQTSLETFPFSWASSIYFALLLPVREAEGRAGELIPEITALIDSTPDFITWHAAAASIAYFAGDDATMVRELDHVARRRFELVEDLTWTAVATVLCRPVWARGERAMAETLYRRLAPYSGLMAWNGLSTHGPVDGGLACLAATMGDSAGAERHLGVCREMVGRLAAPHLWWPELDRLAQQGNPDVVPHLR